MDAGESDDDDDAAPAAPAPTAPAPAAPAPAVAPTVPPPAPEVAPAVLALNASSGIASVERPRRGSRNTRAAMEEPTAPACARAQKQRGKSK